ncbi:sensor histidine kinase [Tessaracoccus caeni]|uniref:sensor histidine kinase n=1 Tax=Tessaracoccus caeni TaxID=3031239 RepID=UPI0023DAA9BE|nr:histidine kinase [Tessaracoccus caeni]MDF1486828.1 histidine kinase [Tessaracoccus caeni]
MDTADSQIRRQLSGRLDVLLAVTGAALATLLNLSHGEIASVALDLVAYTAAACIVRWPTGGGIVLASTLLLLVLLPPGWLTVAEYAALIPVLGAGLRGERRKRLWMTVLYGAILSAVVVRELQGSSPGRILVGLMLWGGMFAFMWVIGDFFTAYRQAQEKARAAALQQQRVELARELHDTVARELSRASLRAQAIQQGHPTANLEPILAGIQRASGQLRWMMSLLREPGTTAPGLPTTTDAKGIIDEAERALTEQGFTVASSFDGDLSRIPTALLPVLRSAVGEACANIERHADPARPCAIVFSVDQDGIDGVFINGLKKSAAPASARGMGLDGLQERLSLVGGELSVGVKGSQWTTRISIPA